MSRFRFACLFLILASTITLAKSNPIPLISQPLVPTSAAPGSGGFTLTVNGARFVSGCLVYWNGSVRSTSFFSSHQLQAQISAADVANANTAWVSVRNPIPGGGLSNIVYFQVQNPVLGLGFRNGTQFSGVSLNTSPVVGDFNGDGKLDVVMVSGANQDTIEVFPGNGDGTFGQPIATARKGWIMNQMIAGDFNNDGKLDLAVGEAISTSRHININMAILLGNGDGTFRHSKSGTIVQRGARPFATVDYDGDGNLDLYSAGERPPLGGIFLGNGDGTFKQQGIEVRGSYAAFGDFDGDGKMDVAVIARNDSFIEVFTKGGKRHRFYPVSGGALSLAVADINGDGKLDLVTDRLLVLLGNGDGTFQNATGGSTDGGGQLLGIGDFNADGKLDAAVGSNLFLGNGDGTFQDPLTFPILFDAIGDFSGDGKLDAVGPVAYTGMSVLLQSRVYLSPSELGFGDQQINTTSPPQTVTVTNFGTVSPLIITQVNFTGANPTDFAQTNNCGSPIPPNGTCQIQVTFAPTLVEFDVASLNVTYKGSGTVSIPVSGNGVDNRTYTVTLTPSSLTYSKQIVGTTSAPQTATLTNTGNQPITISSIAATAPFTQTNNCPATLPVSSNCQIQVAFTPTKVGTAKGTLSVTDNAVDSPQSVTLSGTGISAVVLSPASIDFGNQKVGTASIPIPITLTNIGANLLSITEIAIKGSNPGDFAQTNDCGSSVPPQGHCTITVTFTPAVKGHRSAKVSVSDDGGGSPQTVPLAGTGT